jgi:methyl-accepting chemotaxis protein
VKQQKTESVKPGQFQVKIRLQVKLILLTVLTLAAAVMILGFLAVNTGARVIDELSEKKNLEYVGEGANRIGEAIGGDLKALNELAKRETVTGMDFDTQAASLAGEVGALGYQDIAVMKLDGHAKYLLGGGEFSSGNEFWYQEGFKGNNSISDVAISKVTNAPVIFEVVPIKNGAQVVGLLIGRREPTFLNNVVNGLGDGKNKYGLVISENGMMMAHPNEQLVKDQTNVYDNIEKDGGSVSMGANLQKLDPGKAGNILYQYNGDTKVGYAAPIPGTSWRLVITESSSLLMAPITNLRNTIVLLSLIILLAGGAIAFVISKRVAQPIVAASGFIREISQGHLSERLAITSRDEVGEMTDSLNHLAENLQYAIIGLMQKIANGDVTTDIEVTDEKDEITPVLKNTVETIRGLISETTMLSKAALAGQWQTRGNAAAFAGGFAEIIEGVNATLDTVVDKMIWYEAIIDAVPFPVHVTDNDMKWAFMNKAFEAVMIHNKVITDRQSAIGKECWHADADICRTERCGIRQLLDKGIKESYFEWDGRNNKQDTTFLKNASGEQVGFVEIVTDLTPIIRVSNYTSTEVARVAQNLMALSQGNVDFDLHIGEADEYTSEVSAQFAEIRNSLAEVKESVENLIADAGKLAQAGIAGKLDTRADVSRHQGDFARIVDGVNATLDAVVAPVQEASNTLRELAQGNLNASMVGHYNGDYMQIKEDMNQTVEFLKRYVDEITETLDEIGRGNLDLEITAEYLGDFQEIKVAINNITSDLSRTMADINDAAGQVEAGATQIADGSQALAQGTTEQASSIEELTASMNEVSGETVQNAKFANEANELANDVKNKAGLGNAQMSQMIAAMADINEASNNISKIIKVIDDIAFQTNILALNAAVEAARAGQHGKGFAVVAEEVRTLAARSAEAAKETTILIEGSITKTEAGSKIADQTAESLKDILREVDQVTDLVGSIAKESNNQASEIAQINLGIEQVSQVVQTNSATAEESAAASEELSGQAELLKGKVGSFNLKTTGSGRFRPQPPTSTKGDLTAGNRSEPAIILDDFDLDKY